MENIKVCFSIGRVVTCSISSPFTPFLLAPFPLAPFLEHTADPLIRTPQTTFPRPSRVPVQPHPRRPTRPSPRTPTQASDPAPRPPRMPSLTRRTRRPTISRVTPTRVRFHLQRIVDDLDNELTFYGRGFQALNYLFSQELDEWVWRFGGILTEREFSLDCMESLPV